MSSDQYLNSILGNNPYSLNITGLASTPMQGISGIGGNTSPAYEQQMLGLQQQQLDLNKNAGNWQGNFSDWTKAGNIAFSLANAYQSYQAEKLANKQYKTNVQVLNDTDAKQVKGLNNTILSNAEVGLVHQGIRRGDEGFEAALNNATKDKLYTNTVFG